MMGKTVYLAGCAALALASFASPAAAQNNNAQGQGGNQTLEDRVKKLEQELDQKNADDAARLTRLSTLEQAFADTVWTFDNARPVVTSADARFQMAIRARVQFDTASFMQDGDLFNTTPQKNVQFKDLASGSVVRRAYLGIEGRVFNEFYYEFRLNFGGSNAESGDIINLARIAYVYNWNTAYPSQPHFRINAGVIQPIMTYEDTVSSAQTTFMERAASVNTATSLYGVDPRRGVELTFQQADIFHTGDNLVLSGAFTGQAAATAANNVGDEGTNILGRAAYRVWSDGTGNVSFSNVQIGATAAETVSLSGGATPGLARTVTFQDRPEIRVDGNRLVSTGAIPAEKAWTYGFDAEANFHNFYVFGEYYKYGINRDITCLSGGTGAGGVCLNAGDPDFSGWYIGASWIITGEWKPYNASATNNEMGSFGSPAPIQPFSLQGGTWGAWELAARYSVLDLNWNEGIQGAACTVAGCIRGGDQKIWTVGVNWYLNRNIRMQFNYENTDVNKIGATSPWPEVGQKFSVIAMRLQFTN